MPEKSADPRIDRMVLMYLEGKVTARCYSGKNYTDAIMTPSALGLLVSDGAKIMMSINQELTSATITG